MAGRKMMLDTMLFCYNFKNDSDELAVLSFPGVVLFYLALHIYKHQLAHPGVLINTPLIIFFFLKCEHLGIAKPPVWHPAAK